MAFAVLRQHVLPKFFGLAAEGSHKRTLALLGAEEDEVWEWIEARGGEELGQGTVGGKGTEEIPGYGGNSYFL